MQITVNDEANLFNPVALTIKVSGLGALGGTLPPLIITADGPLKVYRSQLTLGEGVSFEIFGAEKQENPT